MITNHFYFQVGTWSINCYGLNADEMSMEYSAQSLPGDNTVELLAYINLHAVDFSGNRTQNF